MMYLRKSIGNDNTGAGCLRRLSSVKGIILLSLPASFGRLIQKVCYSVLTEMDTDDDKMQ